MNRYSEAHAHTCMCVYQIPSFLTPPHKQIRVYFILEVGINLKPCQMGWTGDFPGHWAHYFVLKHAWWRLGILQIPHDFGNHGKKNSHIMLYPHEKSPFLLVIFHFHHKWMV